MNTQQKCEWLLANKKLRQTNFVRSVKLLIDVSPLAYPTPSQASIIDRIFRHEKRLAEEASLSDVEKQAREYMGLK